MKKFLKWLWVYIKPFLNIKFLICFVIAWMITNGWSYIFLLFGGLFEINWMRNIGAAYLTFLWVPGTPEKILTIAIALIIHNLLFRRDEKSKQMLLDMQKQAKDDWIVVKEKVKKFFMKLKKNDVNKDNKL
mgnify:CR=1 FL=1